MRAWVCNAHSSRYLCEFNHQHERIMVCRLRKWHAWTVMLLLSTYTQVLQRSQPDNICFMNKFIRNATQVHELFFVPYKIGMLFCSIEMFNLETV